MIIEKEESKSWGDRDGYQTSLKVPCFIIFTLTEYETDKLQHTVKNYSKWLPNIILGLYIPSGIQPKDKQETAKES